MSPKCSLTFPLQNGIDFTFYVNFTNKYAIESTITGRREVVSILWVPGYFRYNYLKVWDTGTSFSSKCVQMDPKQLPKNDSNLFRMKQVRDHAEKCNRPQTAK